LREKKRRVRADLQNGAHSAVSEVHEEVCEVAEDVRGRAHVTLKITQDTSVNYNNSAQIQSFPKLCYFLILKQTVDASNLFVHKAKRLNCFSCSVCRYN